MIYYVQSDAPYKPQQATTLPAWCFLMTVRPPRVLASERRSEAARGNPPNDATDTAAALAQKKTGVPKEWLHSIVIHHTRHLLSFIIRFARHPEFTIILFLKDIVGWFSKFQKPALGHCLMHCGWVWCIILLASYLNLHHCPTRTFIPHNTCSL